jgi:hypothetical protein
MTSKVRWRAPAWAVFETRYAVDTLVDDLAVSVTVEQLGPARVLHLGIGAGKVSIAIALGKTPEATFSVPTIPAGEACLAALASWLGVAVPSRPSHALAQPPPITVGAIDMGRGRGGRHVWQLVQLVLGYDARLYLIWRVAGTEAYLCEHEAGDREELVRELAYVLRDGVRHRRETPLPERPCFEFDGEKSQVTPSVWAQKLQIEPAEIVARLEAAGREHVAPLYGQIDTALDAWPDDPRAAAARVMKLPVQGCIGVVWGAIAHRGADSLAPDEIAALRARLRSLAAADFVRRLHHQDEVHALLLR